MANDFSDGLHALESLFSRLRRERGSCAGCEEAPYEIVRSTLTAQQQKIEALRRELRKLEREDQNHGR